MVKMVKEGNNWRNFLVNKNMESKERNKEEKKEERKKERKKEKFKKSCATYTPCVCLSQLW